MFVLNLWQHELVAGGHSDKMRLLTILLHLWESSGLHFFGYPGSHDCRCCLFREKADWYLLCFSFFFFLTSSVSCIIPWNKLSIYEETIMSEIEWFMNNETSWVISEAYDYEGKKIILLKLLYSNMLELYDFCNIIIILKYSKFTWEIKIHVVHSNIFWFL